MMYPGLLSFKGVGTVMKLLHGLIVCESEPLPVNRELLFLFSAHPVCALLSAVTICLSCS